MAAVERIVVDLGEVHEASLDLLRHINEEDLEPTVAVAALIMTAGRLVSPKTLDRDEEEKFIELTMDWATSYFIPRSTN